MSAPDLLSHPVVADLLKRLKGDPLLNDGLKDLFLARAPGCLEVMGAGTDFAGGTLCLWPLANSAAVALQSRDDRQLVIKHLNPPPGAEATVTLSLDDFYGSAALLPQESLQKLFPGPRAWAATIAGIYPTLARHKKLRRTSHGANIFCTTDIPGDASPALTSAALWAMTSAYHLILEPLEIAMLGHRIGNQMAAEPAGLGPYAAAMLGRANQLLLLECQPHDVKGFLPLPAGLTLVGAQVTGAADSDAEPDARVSAAMAQAIVTRMFTDLGVKKDPTRGYLANLSAEQLNRYVSHILPEHLTGQDFLKDAGALADRFAHLAPERIYAPRAAADYHVTENARTLAFIDQIKQLAKSPAAVTTIGQQLHEGHGAAARLGITAPAAAAFAAQLARQPGIKGARATGSIVIALVEDTAQSHQSLNKIIAEAPHAILLTSSSSGAADQPPARVPRETLLP